MHRIQPLPVTIRTPREVDGYSASDANSRLMAGVKHPAVGGQCWFDGIGGVGTDEGVRPPEFECGGVLTRRQTACKKRLDHAKQDPINRWLAVRPPLKPAAQHIPAYPLSIVYAHVARWAATTYKRHSPLIFEGRRCRFLARKMNISKR